MHGNLSLKLEKPRKADKGHSQRFQYDGFAQAKIWQYSKNYIQTTTKSNNIMKNIILQTPSKPGALLRKTFSHTPDEARSVGLVKACVLQKIYSVIEKLHSRI